MQSYQAARSLFSFLVVCGWTLIVLGIILALFGGASAVEMSRWGRQSSGIAFLMGMLPGIGLSLIGFFSLVLAQIGRAGVDTAEYSQQMLEVSREQLQVSQQTLRQGEVVKRGFEALVVAPTSAPTATYADHSASVASDAPAFAPAPAASSPKDVLYNGREIRVIETGYRYAGMEFTSLEDAHRYIDQLGGRPIAERAPKS